MEGGTAADTGRAAGPGKGWRRVSAETAHYLHSDPDLQRPIPLAGFSPSGRAATVEQIIWHITAEEMIHMGEVLAMTRQLGIDLPSYFLMSIMDHRDEPWRRWSAINPDTSASP